MVHKVLLTFSVVIISVNAAKALPPPKNETDLKEKEYTALLDAVIKAMRNNNRQKLLSLMHPDCRKNGKPTKTIVQTTLKCWSIRPTPKKGAKVIYRAEEFTKQKSEQLRKTTNNRFFPKSPEYLFKVDFNVTDEVQSSQKMLSFGATKEGDNLYLVALDNDIVQLFLRKAREKTGKDKQSKNQIPQFYTTTDIQWGKGIVTINGFPVANNEDNSYNDTYHASALITPFMQNGKNILSMTYHPVVRPEGNEHSNLSVELSGGKTGKESGKEIKHSLNLKLEEYAISDLAAESPGSPQADEQAVGRFRMKKQNSKITFSQDLERAVDGIPVLLKFEGGAMGDLEKIDITFVHKESGRKVTFVDASGLIQQDQFIIPLLGFGAVKYQMPDVKRGGKDTPAPKSIFGVTSEGKKRQLVSDSDDKLSPTDINNFFPEHFDQINIRAAAPSGKQKIFFKDLHVITCPAFVKQQTIQIDDVPNMPWTRAEKIGQVTAQARRAIKSKVERIHNAMTEKRPETFTDLMSEKAKAVGILRGISLKSAKQQLRNRVSSLMERDGWALNPLPDEMNFKKINDRVILVHDGNGNAVITGKKPDKSENRSTGQGYVEKELFFAKIDGEWSVVW